MEKPDFEKIASENHNVLYEDMYQGFIMGANHAWEILSAEIEKLEKDNEDLTQWKESEMKIWQPVIDFAQSNKLPGLGPGQSISEYVLKTLKSAAKSQSEPQQQKQMKYGNDKHRHK